LAFVVKGIKMSGLPPGLQVGADLLLLLSSGHISRAAYFWHPYILLWKSIESGLFPTGIHKRRGVSLFPEFSGWIYIG
jgi:hypothetical protein